MGYIWSSISTISLRLCALWRQFVSILQWHPCDKYGPESLTAAY
jgi:hypothetical protein